MKLCIDFTSRSAASTKARTPTESTPCVSGTARGNSPAPATHTPDHNRRPASRPTDNQERRDRNFTPTEENSNFMDSKG